MVEWSLSVDADEVIDLNTLARKLELILNKENPDKVYFLSDLSLEDLNIICGRKFSPYTKISRELHLHGVIVNDVSTPRVSSPSGYARISELLAASDYGLTHASADLMPGSDILCVNLAPQRSRSVGAVFNSMTTTPETSGSSSASSLGIRTPASCPTTPLRSKLRVKIDDVQETIIMRPTM